MNTTKIQLQEKEVILNYFRGVREFPFLKSLKLRKKRKWIAIKIYWSVTTKLFFMRLSKKQSNAISQIFIQIIMFYFNMTCVSKPYYISMFDQSNLKLAASRKLLWVLEEMLVYQFINSFINRYHTICTIMVLSVRKF